MTRPTPSRRLAASLALGLAALGLGGCRERNITAYRIPKDADVQEPAPSPEQPAEAPQMRFIAPAGWQTQPASGMREASFLIAGPGGSTADVSVVSFPRFRGRRPGQHQPLARPAQAAAVAARRLPGQIKSLAAAAGEFVVADMAGTTDKGEARILGAWLRRSDRVWFFKVMGPSDLVEGQKEAFTAFLKSVSLGAGRRPSPRRAPGPRTPTTFRATRPGLCCPPGPGQAPMDSVPVQAARGLAPVDGARRMAGKAWKRLS